MKKIVLLIFLLCQIFAQSQESKSWTYKLPPDTKYRYDYLTKDGIVLIISEEDSLYIIDAQTKKLIVKKMIPNSYERGVIGEVQNYPYFIIGNLPFERGTSKRLIKNLLSNTSKSSRSQDSNYGRSLIINYLNGDTVVDTQNYPSKNNESISIKYDAEAIFSSGKNNGKKRVFTYGSFYDPSYKWQISEPLELKKISLRDEIWKKPIYNQDYLVVGYANNLYGIKRETGKILWSQEKASRKYDYLYQQPKYYRLVDSLFYTVEKYDNITAHYLKNGKLAWTKPIELNRYTTYLFIKEGILKSTKRNTNLYDYKTGKPLWKNDLISKNNIKSISYTGKNLLFNYHNYTGVEINLFNDNQFLWDYSLVIKADTLHTLLPIEKGHFFLSNTSIGIISKEGEIVFSKQENIPDYTNLWYYDKEKQNIFYISNGAIYQLDLKERTDKKFVKLPKVKGEKRSKEQEPERFSRIWAQDTVIAVSASRNLVTYNLEGKLYNNIYYKKSGLSTRLKRTIVGVASFAAASVLKDQVEDIYNEAYSQGLISKEDATLDHTAVFIYGKSVGFGSVASKYADRLVLLNNTSKNASQFKQNWIIEDKDKNANKDIPHGLRVVNILNASIPKFIPISKKKDFRYTIAPNFGGVFYLQGSTLTFKHFDDL